MNHPPLCPKTEGNWMSFAHTGAVDALISDDTYLDDDLPDHRQFIARYQACAWQDRAERFIRAANWAGWRWDDPKSWHMYWWSPKAHDRAAECEFIARAWREWEKQP